MNDSPVPIMTEMGYVCKFVSTYGYKRMPKYSNGYISFMNPEKKIVTLADLLNIINDMTFDELEELARR
tara:strand:+ start:178 stop:384 length:207 start_codon:yes stop_codon:yes gene_type:complete